MPLDPPIRRIFEAAPVAASPAAPMSHDERRRAADATMLLLSTGPQPGVVTEDHAIPVAGGEIAVRVQRPDVLDAPMPALLSVHGGGWFQGTLDSAEVECGPMASLVPCLVALVDYRLAPEHPYPTPLDDCLAAYRWLLDNAGELGVDARRIAVGGGSAGANLAAALCLRVRDEGLASPLLQVLDVPCLDLTLSSPSMTECGTDFGLTRDAVDEYAGFYVGDTPRDHPRVSPLHEPDLTGLPPAVITVAELDPVRDDGERYLARLQEADVPAAAVRVLGHIHGSWVIPLTITSRLVVDFHASTLRRAFAGELVPNF